jgi:hypothetical protein
LRTAIRPDGLLSQISVVDRIFPSHFFKLFKPLRAGRTIRQK